MKNYDALINKYAQLNNLDPNLVRAVIKQESSGNPRAVSPVGAKGLMQLMPRTAASLGVKDAFDEEQNIAGGTRYLAQQIKRFGSVENGLAAYNAGAGKVKKYGGIPPIPETQNYVKKIMANYKSPSKSSNTASRSAAPTAPTKRQNNASLGALSQAFDAQGNVDPQAFLNYFLQGTTQNNAPSTPLYDPFSATSAPNPNYNPQSSFNPFAAIGLDNPAQQIPEKPYDDRKNLMVPALSDQRNQAEKDTLNNNITDSEREQKRLVAQSKLLKAQAEMLKHNPTPELQQDEYVPVPERQQAALPVRPEARLDPMSAIIATLAGTIDNENAGSYASVPLSAGIEQADREYGDRIQHYKMLTDQLANDYEQELNDRNERVRYSRDKNATKYQNDLNKRAGVLEAGNLDAQVGLNDDLAKDDGGFIPREKQAAQSNLQSQQLGRQINEQLGQNQAKQNAELKSQALDAQASRNAFSFLSNLYNYQSRLQGVQQTNNTKKEISTDKNTTAVKVAEIKAKGTLDAAIKRASYAQNHVNSTLAKLPAHLQEKVKRSGQVWANAEKEVTRAYREAEKAFSTDLNAGGDKDTYIENYVKAFKNRADGYQKQYEASLQEAANAKPVDSQTKTTDPASAGRANPHDIPAKPTSGKSGLTSKTKPTPQAKPTTSSISGFSNLQIRKK